MWKSYEGLDGYRVSFLMAITAQNALYKSLKFGSFRPTIINHDFSHRVKGMSPRSAKEMQSQLRQDKRISYAKDVTEDDMTSPNRAVRCYHVLQTTIDNLHNRLDNTQHNLRRMRKKCESLEALVSDLKDKHLINSETRSLIEVGWILGHLGVELES